MSDRHEYHYLLIVETKSGSQVHRVSGQDAAYAAIAAQPILRQVGTENITLAYLVPQSMCTVLGLPISS
jgi:hypothetical protein